MTSHETIATAYHEAGHAVVAISLGRAVEKVSIVGNSLRLGVVNLGKGRKGRREDFFEDDALILLAGLVAEARYSGQENWEGARTDLRIVRRLISDRVTSEKAAERMERKLLEKTDHQLSQPGHWEAVEAVANLLVEKNAVSGRTARHLFEMATKRE